MHIFIEFWKLETENNLLHVFSFLHKLNFENSFCFLPVFSCQTSFFVLKIENYFWKQKIKGKNSYQTYPKSLKTWARIQNLWSSENMSQSPKNPWSSENMSQDPKILGLWKHEAGSRTFAPLKTWAKAQKTLGPLKTWA